MIMLDLLKVILLENIVNVALPVPSPSVASPKVNKIKPIDITTRFLLNADFVEVSISIFYV